MPYSFWRDVLWPTCTVMGNAVHLLPMNDTCVLHDILLRCGDETMLVNPPVGYDAGRFSLLVIRDK